MLRNAASYMSLGASGIIPLRRRVVIKIVKEAALMKKTLLLILLSAIFLFGCGGPSTSEPGGTTPQPPPVGVTDNVTIYIPSDDSLRALVDPGTLVRNAGRVIAFRREVTGQVCVDSSIVWECIGEEGIYYTENPNDPDCYEVTICNATEDVYGLVPVAIADGILDGDTGELSMSVPTGDYVFQVLTYTAGTFDGTFTAFTATDPPTINATTHRINMGENALNLLLNFATSDINTLISVSSGATVTVPVVWATTPLAQLELPPDPVEAGASYQVSAIKSECIGRVWYVQQLLDDANSYDLFYYISEAGDIYTTVGGDTVTLSTTDDMVTGEGPGPNGEHYLWHNAQFFIDQDYLAPGENTSDWTFGTSYAGDLNAPAIIIITAP